MGVPEVMIHIGRIATGFVGIGMESVPAINQADVGDWLNQTSAVAILWMADRMEGSCVDQMVSPTKKRTVQAYAAYLGVGDDHVRKGLTGVVTEYARKNHLNGVDILYAELGVVPNLDEKGTDRFPYVQFGLDKNGEPVKTHLTGTDASIQTLRATRRTFQLILQGANDGWDEEVPECVIGSLCDTSGMTFKSQGIESVDDGW